MELTGNYRHELKYQIGPADHLALRQRLKAVMQQDLHTGADGRYTIRSRWSGSWCCKMKTQQLRPRVLVSYVRGPYVYAAGSVKKQEELP